MSLTDKTNRMKVPLYNIELDGDTIMSLNVSSVNKVNRMNYALLQAPLANIVKQSTLKVKTVYIDLNLNGDVTESISIPNGQSDPETQNWLRIYVFSGTEDQAKAAFLEVEVRDADDNDKIQDID